MSKPTLESLLSVMPSVAFVQRPWGAFKQFASNCPCTVSLMTVEPGKRLSLQAHRERAELWIVLDDGAIVQVGDDCRPRKAGDEIWIPANERHRLGCEGKVPVRVLEVAFGSWKQDDIIRFEDDFSRPEAGDGSTLGVRGFESQRS